LNSPARHLLRDCHRPLSWWQPTHANHISGFPNVHCQLQECLPKQSPLQTQGCTGTLLMSLVPPYHGSTSLLSLFMKNSGISTLCSGMQWECEGGKLGSGHMEWPCDASRHVYVEVGIQCNGNVKVVNWGVAMPPMREVGIQWQSVQRQPQEHRAATISRLFDHKS
jgi:hypothetical protein